MFPVKIKYLVQSVFEIGPNTQTDRDIEFRMAAHFTFCSLGYIFGRETEGAGRQP
jgi:hypothetical protein